MQLYYIRHGQSVNNAGWGTPNYIESTDPILTDIGKQQAQLLGDFLEKNQDNTKQSEWDPHDHHGFRITHLYTSLMERAVQTSMPTVRKLSHIPFTAWTDIHESGGIYGRDGAVKDKGLPGKPRSFFETNYPELALPEWHDESGWWRERPVETEEQAHVRAERVWAELLERHSDREGQPEHRVAVVSHGTFFVHLMGVIINFPFLSASNGMRSWFLLNNCSISRISVYKDEIVVCYINRTDHLPSHLITG
jgi:broad specificity phosphatase PhoE